MPPFPLDPDQRRAVDHDAGPCLVLAGPGSGKTRVIVQRFLRLCETGIDPGRQLVLTYNRRAAVEMRERVEVEMGALPDEGPLTTYHSFAHSVIRAWGWRLGFSPAFRVPNKAERWLHTEAVLRELRPRTLWNPLRADALISSVVDIIHHAKQELVTPERYLAWATSRLETCTDPEQLALLERHRDIATVYGQLQQRYLSHNLLDFEDCILYAEQLIRGDPAVRSSVAGRLRHLMVDEYQDTDFAQSRLIDALLVDHGNILVVADDDQSIYKFRGASRANLERFAAAHPTHERIVLSRNYRSTEEILRISRDIIGAASPSSRIEKRLTATRGPGARLQLWSAPDARAEMRAIAAECRSLIDGSTARDGGAAGDGGTAREGGTAGNRGIAPGTIALLFKRHADMQDAIRALQDAGVPYRVHGGRGFFQQPEIKDLLALLAAAADPDDSQAVLRCLMLPAWRVSNPGRVALVRACDEHDRSLVEVVRDGEVRDLDGEDAQAARRAVDALVELRARAERDDVRDIFHAALEASDLLSMLELRQPLERMQCGANLNRFGELLETFADWSDDRRVATALRYLLALRAAGEEDELATIEPVEEGVALLTAHAAKGLEWPVVFVPACIESRWPGWQGGGGLELPDELVPEQIPTGDAAGDEERRLFYVAVTRARDRLVLSWARRYPTSHREEHPSPFLAPLLAEGSPVDAVDLPPALEPVAARPRHRGAVLEGRPSVSVSELRDYTACPRRFQYSHIFRMPRPRSPQRWYGQLMHAVLQNAAMRRATGEEIGGDELAQLWSSAWEAAPGQKGRDRELRRLGDEQLRRYGDLPAWREARIIQVEQPFAMRTTAADIRGRFDRVDLDGEGRPIVVDYKTGPPRDPAQEARDLQVRAYAAGLAQRDGVDAVGVELHRMQTGEVTRVTLGKPQLNKAFGHVSATAAELADALRARDFPPRPSSWHCARCDYRTVCDEGRAAAVG